MRDAEKIARLTDRLELAVNEVVTLRAALALAEALNAKLRRTLNEADGEIELQAHVYAHDSFWDRVSAVEG